MLCCVAALQRLRGWKDVEEEMTEMRLEEQSERAEGQLSVLKLFTFRSLRWQLLSIIIMNMGQQLSGVNAVSHVTPIANRSEHHSFLLHLSMCTPV